MKYPMQNKRIYEMIRPALKKLAVPVLCAIAAPLVLCSTAALFFGACYGLVCTPVQVDVTLLKDQPFSIEGKKLVLTDDETIGCITYEPETQSVDTSETGEGSLRVVGLLNITDYRFHVVDAVPQSQPKQVFTIGDTAELEEQAGAFPVKWQSSDSEIASVDESGQLTCKTAGVCEVTETLNDYLTYTYNVTVLSPILPVEEMVIYPGEEQELAVLNYDQPIEWKIDSDCVKVDENNVITGTEAGVANISAFLGEEEYSATVCVSKLPEVQETMELYVGETAELPVENAIDEIIYTANPVLSEEEAAEGENEIETLEASADGDEEPEAAVAAAAVDEAGVITAVEPGTADITASVRGQEATCQVTVKLRPEDEFQETNYGDYQPETSIAAQTLIGICEHYNDVMMADDDPWYNSNWNDDVSKAATFDDMTTADVKGSNCANLFNWAMRDMGLLSTGQTNLYGDAQGKLHGYDSKNKSLKKAVDEVFEVIEYEGEKTLTELLQEDAVQPGDILFNKLHTFIYRGEGTVFGSANDGKVNKEGKYPVFISWVNEVKHSYDRKKPITYLIRFKEDYIPQFYYNKDAELVENPLFTAIEEEGYEYDPTAEEPEKVQKS